MSSESLQISFLDLEFQLFLRFLPYFVAGDSSDFNDFEEPYMSILGALRYLSGDTGLKLSFMRVFTAYKNGQPTHFITALVPSKSAFTTPLGTFLGDLQELYGQCADFQHISHYMAQARASTTPINTNNVVLLQYNQPIL